jgi:hypothetical protein
MAPGWRLWWNSDFLAFYFVIEHSPNPVLIFILGFGLELF